MVEIKIDPLAGIRQTFPMYSPRKILVLLVLAQLVGGAVGQLLVTVNHTVVTPMQRLIFGDGPEGVLQIGPFPIGVLIRGVISCGLSLLLGTLLLVLLLKFCWRWLEKALPHEPAGPK